MQVRSGRAASHPRQGFSIRTLKVPVLAYGTDRAGEGPRLHVHPYDEVFVVTEGRGRFFVGDAIIDAFSEVESFESLGGTWAVCLMPPQLHRPEFCPCYSSIR
jgi:hypothetical protein